MTNDREPNDSFLYSWLSFNNDTIHFYLESIKFYEGLLRDDIAAIQSDKDLAFLLQEPDRDKSEIQKELDRSTVFREWIEVEIEKRGHAA